MNTFARTVLRNSAVGLAAQLAIKVLSFGFSIFIIRNLGAEDFGQYAAISAFGAIFLFIADLGLGTYTVRQVARLRDSQDGEIEIKNLYGNVLFLRLVLSALASVLLLSVAWITGRPLVMIGAIALNTLGIMMYGAQGTFDMVLAGYERLDLSSRAKVIYQIAFIGLGTVALLMRTGYYGLIIASLGSIAMYTLTCWRWVRLSGVHFGKPALRAWLPLLRMSVPFAIISFALGLSYKFDSVLLNIFRTDQETGFYNAAYNLIFSAVIISNVVNTSLYPSLTRQANTNPTRLAPVVERVMRYLITIALPITVGIWALANPLVTFLYSSNYQPTAPALQIIIWVVPFMYLSEFLGYVVLITGREKIAARSVLISTGFNVAINLWVVPHYGYLGAAVMTVLTEMVLVGQYTWVLVEMLSKLNWVNVLLRPLVASTLMGAVVLILRSEVSFPASVAIGGVTYVIFLFMVGAFGKDDFNFIRTLRMPSKVDNT